MQAKHEPDFTLPLKRLLWAERLALQMCPLSWWWDHQAFPLRVAFSNEGVRGGRDVVLLVGQFCAAVFEATAAGVMAEVWQQGVEMTILNVMFPASTPRGNQTQAASGLLPILTTYGSRMMGKWTFDLTRRIAFILTET